MDSAILLGLAKRVALIARDALGVPQKSDGLVISENNSDVLVEIISASKLRKKPLVVRVNSERIKIENLLIDISGLNELEKILSELRFEQREKIRIETIVNEDLSIEIKYDKDISLNVLDNVVRDIFMKIKEIWLKIIFTNTDYAIKNFGVYGINFFGEKFILARIDFDELLSNVSEYWLPNKTISLPSSKGAFVNGNVGIDYVQLPILSTIIKDGDKVDFLIYYLKDNYEISSIKFSDAQKLYKMAKNILTKVSSEKLLDINIMNLDDSIELVSNPSLWKRIIIALKELILESSLNGIKKMKRIRPSFFEHSLDEPDKPETILSERDKNIIIQLLPKLERMKEITEIIYSENKLFTEMVLGRLLATLAAEFSKLFILYGDLLNEEMKNIRRTRNSASINLNLKKLGIQNIPNKAKVKVIRNNNKEFIIIEL